MSLYVNTAAEAIRALSQ
ncbi:hypothetical protein OKA71_RS27270, partial [Escherichia coli]